MFKQSPGHMYLCIRKSMQVLRNCEARRPVLLPELRLTEKWSVTASKREVECIFCNFLY